MNTLCLYHKNCTDGLAAALAVRRYWSVAGKLDQCDFKTIQYGDEAPNVDGRDVLIVDFSFPRSTLEIMHQQAKSLFVIDHHKTAEAELQDLDYCIFDMSKSGAVLTWEYLFPNEPLPLLFEYVQDRDLWTWELPFSKEVSAALRSYKPFLDEWEQFLDDTRVHRLQAEGIAILRYQQRQIEMVLSRPASMVEIGGYSVPCINSTTLISEIGNELSKDYPFAAMYFDTNDGKRVFSLRSTDDGIDVSVIAKQYGGGGHPHASGFTIARPDIFPK